MTVPKWIIGEVEIFPIFELQASKEIQSIIAEATKSIVREIDWLPPHFADEVGHFKAVVQGFLVKSAGRNILVDTCIGNFKKRTDGPQWGNLRTGFLSDVRALVQSENNIDVVICTHLHNDHVGWNTNLQGTTWVPTFPRARYLFGRQEYEYAAAKGPRMYSDDKAAFDDSVEPIVAAGLAQLVEMDHIVDKNIRLIPTPGHSIGHVSVLVESKGQRGIITGDMIHHPCQIAQPQWSSIVDYDPAEAASTRQSLLKKIAGTDTLLIGSHFAEIGAGRVIQTADGFALGL